MSCWKKDIRDLEAAAALKKVDIIFSDGIENDYLQFNSGVEAKIIIAEKKGHLVI